MLLRIYHMITHGRRKFVYSFIRMSLLDIGPIIFGSTESLLDFFTAKAFASFKL